MGQSKGRGGLPLSKIKRSFVELAGGGSFTNYGGNAIGTTCHQSRSGPPGRGGNVLLAVDSSTRLLKTHFQFGGKRPILAYTRI